MTHSPDCEYEQTGSPCPFCGHSPLHTRNCEHCDDGYVELYDEDPLWYDEDDIEACEHCRATGVLIWCPSCGKDPREDKVWARDGEPMSTEPVP